MITEQIDYPSTSEFREFEDTPDGANQQRDDVIQITASQSIPA